MSERAYVAREAARLLYTGAVEEYIQAKEMAAANLGTRAVPSNYEVALELDRLADEAEGGERQSRLIHMRNTALQVMRNLSKFNPQLTGSVWRGIARRGSDIDIIALSRSPEEVEAALKGYTIKEKREVTFKGSIRAYHFKFDVPPDEVEVVVRDPTDYTDERCDIFGDVKRGVKIVELEKLLRIDPIRRFVPRRRSK